MGKRKAKPGMSLHIRPAHFARILDLPDRHGLRAAWGPQLRSLPPAEPLPETAVFAKRGGAARRPRRHRGLPRSLRTLVPSVDGRIEQILLTMPRYTVRLPSCTESPVAPLYRELFRELRDRALVILTVADVEVQVREWLEKARVTRYQLLLAPPDSEFTPWAEDPYATVLDRKRTCFAEPYEFSRPDDQEIADAVGKAIQLPVSTVPLYFQGGNLLIGDDFFLIGADYPRRTLDYIRQNVLPIPPRKPPHVRVKEAYLEYLEHVRKMLPIGSLLPIPSEQIRVFRKGKHTWREVLYRNNQTGTVQPLFHIDMFLTLAGRSESGKYRILVGSPKFAADVLHVTDHPDSLSMVFDSIASYLEQHHGFEVHRNPMPFVYLDNPRTKTRLWYYATANNAMVEMDGTHKQVWLPTYGHGKWRALRKTDQQNAAIWQGLGFTVRMLGDYHALAVSMGSLHCIKKYLRRRPVRRRLP